MQLREQIETDFEEVTKAVLRAMPYLRWHYDSRSSQSCPLHAHVTYKNLDSKRKDFLVLAVSVFIREDTCTLEIRSDLDRDNVDNNLAILPYLPNGPTTQMPLPLLKGRSQAEIEALFDLPSVVSMLENMIQPTRRFLKDEATINAIIQEELNR